MTVLDDELLAAADAIVTAFGNHDALAYFDGFALDASFIFYNVPDRLESRAAYESLWAGWEADHKFRVHGCISSNRRVLARETVGIFMHDVQTEVEMDGLVDTMYERETIVFEKRNVRWLAVHEHLSPRPEPGPLL